MSDSPSPPTTTVVCGIGASAGGLQALEAFFDAVPCDTGTAYIVVQHLSPDYKSMMDELLRKHTAMPIRRIEDGMQIEPDVIYLNVPRHMVTLDGDTLRLTEQDRESLTLPIDVFFASLAKSWGSRAVAVILSGTGSDGSRGIRAVRAHEGTVMVQEPSTASFDGMPRSAVATRVTDFVKPVDELARILVRFALDPDGHALAAKLERDTGGAFLDQLCGVLLQSQDVDFSEYRSNTILRRADRRMQLHQLTDPNEYISLLKNDAAEAAALYTDLLINVTHFFRDPEAYDALRTKVIPRLFQGRDPRDGLRIWSVGCSTGEEPYSLAMLLRDYADEHRLTHQIKIFATDVDQGALEIASAGEYPVSIEKDVPPELFSRYFSRRGDFMKIADPIRRMLIFAKHDITRGAPFYRLDLITCRNLLIYFEPSLQKKVLSIFHFGLNEGGYLWLGSSESLGDADRIFETVESRPKLFRLRTATTRPLISSLGLSQGASREGPLGRNVVLSRTAARHTKDTHTMRLLQAAVRDYAPPALVVDENLRVVMTFGAITPYLSIEPGPFTAEVAKLVIPALRQLLVTFAFKVMRDGTPSVYHDVRVPRSDKDLAFDIEMGPFRTETPENLFVILFREKVDPHGGDDLAEFEYSKEEGLRIRQLESELTSTKENLQATIEELETSNEELQATNEELVASNEELQATNEELQSVNEELITVNAEYQQKLEEISRANADINNLLTASAIGTLVLDDQLRISRFSPRVAADLDLLPADTGRPVGQLSFSGIAYGEFVQASREVLKSGILREVELSFTDGRSQLVRVVPYQSGMVHSGVILTFIDVTRLRSLENRIRVYESRFEQELRKRLEGQKLRVLHVEDDDHQVALLGMVLEDAGIQADITRCRTCAETRTLLEGGYEVDLMLLDILLPDGDGLALLAELRRKAAFAELPVVVNSALIDPDVESRAHALGALSYITKPMERPQLNQIIRRLGVLWYGLAAVDRNLARVD